MIKKNDKKTIHAWAMFDWANSAYNLVITSTIFPAYYTLITTTKEHADKVFFFGKRFTNTALSTYALSIAYLIGVVLLPILSSISDYRGNKRIFMKMFTYLGALSCMGLYFFELETLEFGIICFTLAAIGYNGGVAFNNSYLPEIATIDRQDDVSAQGFSYGYVGSVLLQLICFIFVLKPEWFGIMDTYFPAQLSFLLVGIWWVSFAQIPFQVLPAGSPNYNSANKLKIHSGFQELIKVWKQIKKMTFLKRYLLAFFFYSMGVQTVMIVAAGFGEKVLHLGTKNLITIILIIQLVAILGAMMMSYFAKKIGDIQVLIIVVSLWIIFCFFAYYTTTANQFYLLAVLVGLVMGGIQSLSRSTYSKLIPENTPDTASFFSFYDVTENLGIVIGLFSFAYIEELTGNIRNSILSLSSFFFIGLFLLVSLLVFKKPSSVLRGTDE